MVLINKQNYPFLEFLKWDKIEQIWNDKIERVLIYFNKSTGRWALRVKFINSSTSIERGAAAWICEIKYNKKMSTSRVGGDETVDHIDENKLNDNPNNLQLISSSENTVKSSTITGRHVGENNVKAKLNNEQVLEILDLYYNKRIPQAEIAKKYNISTVNGITGRKIWNNIDFSIPENFIRPDDTKAVLTADDVLNILKLYYHDKNTIFTISKKYPQCRHGGIQKIIYRIRWKHIPFDIPEDFIKPKAEFIKLTENQIIAIRLKRLLFKTPFYKLGDEFNTDKVNIFDICSNKSWKHVTIPDVYDFYIYNKRIISIPGNIIIIGEINYTFLGKVTEIPNINCIYINNNEVIKKTIGVL